MFRYVTNVNLATRANSASERSSLMATSSLWLTVVICTYPVEFLCSSVAQLMVLDRMWRFATPRSDEALWRRWEFGGRLVMALVVCGNLVGLIASFVGAAYFDEARDSFSQSSSMYASGRSAAGDALYSQAQAQNQKGYVAAGAHYIGEISVLLLIIFAFAVVGVACAIRIAFAMRRVARVGAALSRSHKLTPVIADVEAQGKKLRLQIVGSSWFVFVSLLLRCVYSSMRSIAFLLQDAAKVCPEATSYCDSSCYNMYTHMQAWMVRTPEFQVSVVLISSPIALLVALGGMKNKVVTQRDEFAQQFQTGMISNPTSGKPPSL
jgi:hypothetical protein